MEQEINFYREREKIDYALEIGRPDQAIDMLQKVLQVTPDDPYFLTSLARAYLESQQLDKAEAAVLESLRVDPDFFWTHGIYALILWEKGENTKAEEEFLTGLSLNPLSQMLLEGFSRFLIYEKNNPEKAKEYLQRLLQMDPENEDAHFLLGELGLDNDDFEKAEESYLHALSLNPEHAYSYLQLGKIYLYKKNEPKKAFEYLKNAIRLDPTNQETREDFIQALKAKNKFYATFWSWTLLLTRAGKWKWALILGPWFLMRILRGYVRENPEYMLYLTPIAIVYVLFCIYTWVADPLFSLFAKKGWIK